MKVLSVCFHGSTQLHYRAAKATGWCDAFYLKPSKLVGGVAGSIDGLKKLGINYNKYKAALIFQDGLGYIPNAQKYFYEQCARHGITIYANQHGFNKSILQIVRKTPNIYSKYWNSMGPYFLERYGEVVHQDAIDRRWISVGSLVHDYLYRNFRWQKKNNGKALIIHEPDLTEAEGDPHPHDSETITRFIIAQLNKAGIKADMKPHPNWKNFVGTFGKPLDKPKGVNIVNTKVEDIVNYALIIGSRSSMLLEAAVMGVPTLAVASTSSWDDDKYPPVESGETGLIPTYSRKNFQIGLTKHFNRIPKYKFKDLTYFCGPLGKTQKKYYDFIKADLEEPQKLLGAVLFDRWQYELNLYRSDENSLIKKVKLGIWVAYKYFTGKKI